MSMTGKERADQFLVARGLAESRVRAQALILAGQVYWDDRRADKPGVALPGDAALTVTGPDHPWVGRGGLKLDSALTRFGLMSCLALAAILSLQSPALADSAEFGGQVPLQQASEDPSQLALAVGWYDFAKLDDQAADFRVEYRSDLAYERFRPWVGLEVTSDRAVFLAAGLLRDIDVSRRIVLTPSGGVGFYEDGGGKNLGSTLEFRLQADLGYKFDDGTRLALSFSHLSNARIGGNNPGAEIISLYYIVPFDRLF